MQRTLRTMNVAAMIDETFDIYKQNFLLLVGIAAVIHIPMNVLIGVLGEGWGSILSLILVLPLGYVAQAATTYAVSRRYLGQDTTIMASYRVMLRRAFPFVGTMLLTSMIIALGFVLLIIPGVIFSFWYAFVSEVFVVEGLSGADARNRSKALADNEVGRIFLLGLLVGLISMGVQAVVGMLPGLVISTLHGPALSVLQGIVTGIASTLTVPLYIIAFILLYYDIRIRKEGFDIEMLAQNLSGEAPVPVQQEVPALDLGKGDGSS